MQKILHFSYNILAILPHFAFWGLLVSQVQVQVMLYLFTELQSRTVQSSRFSVNCDKHTYKHTFIIIVRSNDKYRCLFSQRVGISGCRGNGGAGLAAAQRVNVNAFRCCGIRLAASCPWLVVIFHVPSVCHALTDRMIFKLVTQHPV